MSSQEDYITFEGTGPGGGRPASAAAANSTSAGPGPLVRELYKLTNIAMSSALVALLRAWSNPPTPPAPPAGADALPDWYQVIAGGDPPGGEMDWSFMEKSAISQRFWQGMLLFQGPPLMNWGPAPSCSCQALPRILTPAA
jgi:hypothetical protein